MLDNVNDIVNIIFMKRQQRLEKCLSDHRFDNQIHLPHEIIKAHQAILSVFSREVGMPAAKLALLRILAISYPQAMGVMELARRLGVNASAVTRLVKEMETDHLIGRFSDSKDGRRNNVKLIPEGVQILEQMRKRAYELEARLCKRIDPDDLAATVRVLSQVRAAIEEQQ
jgi:DNA-binding MarR family transcriptional regulator